MSNYISIRLEGRTGNMMFEIAHGYAKALKYNRQFLVPNWLYSTSFDTSLFRKLDFSNNISTEEDHIVRSPFKYTNPQPNDDKPTIFAGFYQSDKHFKEYSEAIKSLYSPTEVFLNKVRNKYPFISNSVVAAINVRRGDYLTQPTRHPVIGIDYINEAYKHLPAHDHLLIMSDDIEWCKENIRLPNTVFSDNTKFWDHEGIWLLSLCNHFIISNSTFSWWGAWLSRSDDKVVISPDTWFGPDITEDSNDIYCDNWIRVPTKWEDGYIILK